MLRIISFLILFCILGLFIMFAALNASSITVNYIIGTKEMPVIALIFISLVIGVLLGFFSMIWKVIGLKAKLRSMSSKLKKSEDQLKKTDLTIKEA